VTHLHIADIACTDPYACETGGSDTHCKHTATNGRCWLT